MRRCIGGPPPHWDAEDIKIEVLFDDIYNVSGDKIVGGGTIGASNDYGTSPPSSGYINSQAGNAAHINPTCKIKFTRTYTWIGPGNPSNLGVVVEGACRAGKSNDFPGTQGAAQATVSGDVSCDYSVPNANDPGGTSASLIYIISGFNSHIFTLAGYTNVLNNDLRYEYEARVDVYINAFSN